MAPRRLTTTAAALCRFGLLALIASPLSAANPDTPAPSDTPATSASTSAAGSGPSELTDDQCVQLLGAADFQARDRARLELERRGLSARAAIEAGVKSSDQEIRRRCEVILASIDAADKRQRLDQLVALAANSTPEAIQLEAEKLKLPAWTTFARYAGTSVEARQLYRDIMTLEWNFIAQSAEQPQQAPMLLTQRLDELTTTGTGIVENPSATINAFLLSSLIAGQIADATSTRLQILVRDSAYGANTSSQRGAPVRQLLGGWVTDVRGGMLNHFHALAVSRTYRLSEAGAARARTIIQLDTKQGPLAGTSAMLNRQALQTLMEFGTAADVKLLLRLLDDSSVVTTTSVGGPADPNAEPAPRLVLEVRVSDLALYTALVLEGRDVRQFGFSHVPSSEARYYFDTHAGFVTDQDRQAAMRLWNERPPLDDQK